MVVDGPLSPSDPTSSIIDPVLAVRYHGASEEIFLNGSGNTHAFNG